MKIMPVAYQLYSARDQAEKDLKKVLLALRDMGYNAVEFAGFYGHSAAEITQMLEETGMRGISSHVPYFEILADMQGVITFHQAIGCRYIAVPYLDDAHRPGAAGFAGALREMNRFGAMCAKRASRFYIITMILNLFGSAANTDSIFFMTRWRLRLCRRKSTCAG